MTGYDGGGGVTMIELPQSLQQALDQQRGQPLPLVDPRTNIQYLLVRADLFERIEYAEQEPDLDKVNVGELIARVMREEDEGDPSLHAYQEEKKPE
jgi:hypothetical protein